MKFYTNSHPFIAGLIFMRDFYTSAFSMPLGKTVLHKEIKAHPEALLQVLSPYLGKIVVGVECMHCWYWVSDFL